MAIVLALLGHISILGCALGVAFGIFITSALIQFKFWYYNRRLMCVEQGVCAAGTVVGQPFDAFDGDRKIDMLIAPFDVPETEQLLIEVLDDMRGTLPNVPDLIDLQNRQVRFGYIRGLSDAQLKEVYIGLADNKMFSQAGREFQRHYYRRDQNIMGNAAFSNSPDDNAANPADSNPMFRYTPEEGGDPEENVLVPWLHCEVEGNRMERWLENILVGWIAGLAAFTALCVACEIISLGALDFLCGPLAGLAAAAVAFLAWLLSHFINDPNDGVANDVDVDVEDADFDTPPAEARRGDVVFMFGDWVMDTEHDQYFEVHPVKAYYLLCRDIDDPDQWVLSEEVQAAACEFNVRELIAADMERMCKIVQAVENTDPDDKFTTDVTHAMAIMP
jgi:hypothetical protein